jgi:N-acetylglutamate synthase-like GNAT family acetyltransferase
VTISIRHATGEDAARVTQIYVDSWNLGLGELMPQIALDDGRISRWVKDLTTGPATWCVAEYDGSVAGLVGIGPSRDPVDPRLGELDTIAVDPPYWRSGIGTRLMHVALQALAAGYPEAILWTLANYPRGQRFYESTGWHLDGASRDNGHQVSYRENRGGVGAEFWLRVVLSGGLAEWAVLGPRRIRRCPDGSFADQLLRAGEGVADADVLDVLPRRAEAELDHRPGAVQWITRLVDGGQQSFGLERHQLVVDKLQQAVVGAAVVADPARRTRCAKRDPRCSQAAPGSHRPYPASGAVLKAFLDELPALLLGKIVDRLVLRRPPQHQPLRLKLSSHELIPIGNPVHRSPSFPLTQSG